MEKYKVSMTVGIVFAVCGLMNFLVGNFDLSLSFIIGAGLWLKVSDLDKAVGK
jgi:hypothetical protein